MPRVITTPLLSVLLVLLLAGTSGCGQKGPLYREGPVDVTATVPVEDADDQNSEPDRRAD
ncbi:MAG: hypothetical protein EA349_16075 [Halomonadaceae bacterium]|nr:MAG: hypothetical protein EA349_16075 [Halomonadaceae bacterium]